MSPPRNLGLLPSIPYHLGRRDLDLPRLTLRPSQDSPLHVRCPNGKEGWEGFIQMQVVPLLLAVRVVCESEKEGRLNGDLCLLFYELGLFVGFL